jgi:cytochrome c oxidase subunit 2
MNSNNKMNLRRVLIASSHPLFGQGLRSLLKERKDIDVQVVGMVSNLEEAISALEELNPDMIIVDYDDEKLNREDFLVRFVEGEKKLRVVLLSLQSSEEALVYDRRTLAASDIDEWLKYDNHVQEIGDLQITSDPMTADDGMNRRTNMKHLIIAAILVLISTLIISVGMEYIQLLPVQASAQAVPIDRLFGIEFKIIAFLFSLIVVFMIYSIVVFRRKPGDMDDAVHIEGNTKLEVTWTIIPLITVMALAYLGGQALAETMRADPRPIEIEAIGQQWSWRFEYPEFGVVSNILMMPVNKQALVSLSSNDVIHSFWVPEFRVKQDALPGGEEFVRQIRITPTMKGDYKVRCAELCGEKHADMRAPVKVVSNDEFQEWIAEESGLSDDPIERGGKWVEQYGCISCHSLDGNKSVGPTWKGIFGSQETLTDGTSVTVNEDYIRDSIINPGQNIVQGFSNVMPANFGQQLTDQQIIDIIEFIKSLE